MCICTPHHTGNGVIDKQELRTLLESVGGDAPKEHWLTDSELDSIHQLYDKDHNGTISFDEFVHIAEDGVLLEGKLHEYQAVFQAMDTDGDEFLSATEVHAMMKQLGVPNVDMVWVVFWVFLCCNAVQLYMIVTTQQYTQCCNHTPYTHTIHTRHIHKPPPDACA